MDTYSVRAYYGCNAKYPKQRNAFAFETWDIGETVKDMEVNAALSRTDIGKIEVRNLTQKGPWKEVYNEEANHCRQ